MGDPLDLAFITAVVLCIVQAQGPRIRGLLRNHARQVQSFGGGVGLAYVFLQLFPEIDLAHEWLGDHVHLVTLVSFLAFYALEVWLFMQATRGPRASTGSPDTASEHAEARPVFWLHVGIIAFYSAMVVFTLPDDIADDALFAIVGGLTIGIHLVYKDYVLRQALDEQFQATGRWVLATAPLLGWALHRILQPSEIVLDLVVALLAGLLIQSVFRDEVPKPDRASLGWIVAGVATFAALSILS